MTLLNVGCGAARYAAPWINLDDLHSQLALGTPERDQLSREGNYVNHDIASGPLPFADETFDGVLASHVIEHFDAPTGAFVMRECRRVLRPNGVLLVSVPDASYFRRVHAEDTPDNAVRLFGEPIHLPDGESTFFGYALWNRWHKAILTDDALWAYFVRAGFASGDVKRIMSQRHLEAQHSEALSAMRPALNRTKFSLVMQGVRT